GTDLVSRWHKRGTGSDERRSTIPVGLKRSVGECFAADRRVSRCNAVPSRRKRSCALVAPSPNDQISCPSGTVNSPIPELGSSRLTTRTAVFVRSASNAPACTHVFRFCPAGASRSDSLLHGRGDQVM